jgi:hypothetical protein
MAREPKSRYDNPPISKKTRDGMSLNIDDLGAIGRLLSLQDNWIEEQMQEVRDAIACVNVRIDDVERRVDNCEGRLDVIEDKLGITKK